jgi:hypothetical protein
MNGLSLRERRLVALALLMAVVAAVWLGVVQPIAAGFAERAGERADAVDAYLRGLRTLRAYPRLKAQAQMQRATAGGWSYVAASPAAAADAARDRQGRLVAAGGGTMRAIRTETASGGTARLQADLQAPLPGLVQLLRALHDGAPPAVVETLSLAASDPAGGAHGAPLQARVDVAFPYAAPLTPAKPDAPH